MTDCKATASLAAPNLKPGERRRKPEPKTPAPVWGRKRCTPLALNTEVKEEVYCTIYIRMPRTSVDLEQEARRQETRRSASLGALTSGVSRPGRLSAPALAEAPSVCAGTGGQVSNSLDPTGGSQAQCSLTKVQGTSFRALLLFLLAVQED